MKKVKLISAVILISCMCVTFALSKEDDASLQGSYEFLTRPIDQGGVLYMGTAGALTGKYLPLSYRDSFSYWGAYVCNLSGNNCSVTDEYHPDNYTLTGQAGSPGRELQTERVNVHNGTDIYDAATWQIAVMLGSTVNNFSGQVQAAYDLVSGQNLLLKVGYDGNASAVAPNANRALTQANGTFTYNGTRVTQPEAAYFFRMVPRNWLSTDPLQATTYATYITANNLPENSPEYAVGKLTWEDWKPITGENAWAFLEGPLQADYLHFIVALKGSYIPFNSDAVQNAIKILPAFSLMQSKIGAVYYATQGSLGNQGDEPVNPFEVSVENNASLFGGLLILQKTLEVELSHQTNLSDQDKATINQSVALIKGMLDGNEKTDGLFSFFKNYAWKDGTFIQGGLANADENTQWQPTLEPKAVDVNTWTIAVLGQKKVDEWFGFGAAYNAWQKTKAWGGYGVGTELWGVGFSNQDGNGVDEAGQYQQGIMSAEWTAGAINMLRVLIGDYGAIPDTDPNYKKAQEMIVAMQQDEASMVTHIEKLRKSNYVRAKFPGTPDNYSTLISTYRGAYLYASKRYMIPFGWYANPLPSTCGTAWVIMITDNFNPFRYGGGYGS